MSAPRRITEGERSSMTKKLMNFYEKVYTLKDGEGETIADTFHALPPRSLTDYYKMIKKPMSLQKIRLMLNGKKYSDPQSFINDLAQIVWNAKYYNVKGSLIYEHAQVLEDFINDEVLKTIKKDTKIFNHDGVIYPYLGDIPEDVEEPPVEATTEPSNSVPVATPAVAPNAVEEQDENEDDEDEEEEEEEKLRASGDRDYVDDSRSLTTSGGSHVNISNGDQLIQGFSASENQALLNAWIKRGRPPIIDRPHEQRIKNIMRNLKKVKSDRGEIITNFFEKLPNPQNFPDYYEIISNPISFREVKDRIKQRAYDSVQPYLNDMYLLISNAKVYYTSDPVKMNNILILERNFQQFVNDESTRLDSEYLQNDSSHQLRIPIDVLEVNGVFYKVGNWILLKNPNDETKPIIGQIFRIWSVPDENNQRYVNVCWYYRSEWTTHRSDRLFLENEVFKTGQYRDHIAEDIIGPCYVAYFTRWLKGDPDFKFSGPMFICEYRFNDHDKNFNKIRTWRACLPDEVRHIEDPIRILNEPRLLKKYLSPIRHLLPPDAKDEAVLPEPIIGNLNAPPIVGAVYYKTPSVDDDPNQYYCSLNPENTNLGAPLPETNPVDANGNPVPVKSYTAFVSANVRVPFGSSLASGEMYSGSAPRVGSPADGSVMLHTGIHVGSASNLSMSGTPAPRSGTPNVSTAAAVSTNGLPANNPAPTQSALPGGPATPKPTNYSAYPSHYSNSNYQSTKLNATGSSNGSGANSSNATPATNNGSSTPQLATPGTGSNMSRPINMQAIYANQNSQNQRLAQIQNQAASQQFHRTIMTPYNSVDYHYSAIHHPTKSSAFVLDSDHDGELDLFARDGLTTLNPINYQRVFRNIQQNSVLAGQSQMTRPDEVEQGFEPLLFFRGVPVIIPNRIIPSNILKSDPNRVDIKRKLESGDAEDEIMSDPTTLGLKIPKLGHSVSYLAWKLKQKQEKEAAK